MSIIGIGMNLFLGVLLIAALVMGWRLERRLRGVRDSHMVFTKAVGELDAATARAHAGLAELRAATDEAIDLLGGRISRAREAADRLDQGLSEAETLVARLALAQDERRAPSKAEPAAPAHLLLELAKGAGVRPAVAAAMRSPVKAKARPSIDDELFEDVGGGR